MTEKEIQKQLQDFYAWEEGTQGGVEEGVQMC